MAATKEFGLFSDEGLVEGQFFSPEEAQAAIEDRYSEEDGLSVREVCPSHEDQPAFGCQECES